MKMALIALVVVLITPSPTGQSTNAGCGASDLARSLCDVEALLTDALRRNDVTALSKYYADEFRLINCRGRRVDRTAVLAAIKSGALRFDSLSTSEVEVRVYGQTGIVNGIQHQVAREPGGGDQAHPTNVRFTHIYVLRGGRWQLVSTQITPLLTP